MHQKRDYDMRTLEHIYEVGDLVFLRATATGGASLSFTSESRYFDRRSAFRGSIECIRTAIETQFCHSVHDSGRYSNRFPRLIKRRFPSKCITSTDKRG